ncbi:MAG: invasion associated locus B family protein [Pseudomonadota bacterium]
MIRMMKVVLPCAAMLAASVSFAQETAPETPATGTAEQIREQLSLGTTGDGTVELGQPYTAEVIGDWEMRCIKTEAEEDPCQMYQLMDDGQGAPVAEFSLFRLPDGGKAVAGATVVVPLETSLTNQLAISVDGGEARRYPFAFCAAVGCYARVGLTAADVSAFKAGAQAVITIVPAAAPDQKVDLTMSLTGFTASFDKVSVIAP